MTATAFGETPRWTPRRPKIRLVRLATTWFVGALAFLVAAEILPGASVNGFGGALVVALLVALLNAIVPPIVAAIRLPWTVAAGFLLALVSDALIVLAVSYATNDLHVRSFWSALAVAILASGVSVALSTAFGTNDDDVYSLRVIQRVARRSKDRVVTDTPGVVFLEIDGLALPVLQRAMRDGSAPNLHRWLDEGTHVLAEWETDLSSQTGASQAGILLGSNVDIPAFRWVEKDTGKIVACSSPVDCAELERRHSSGNGLLAGGGASRGNLFSGDADHLILTVSKMDVERHANPGYRAFLANGFNVARSLTLFFWEVILEYTAAARARARDIQPRGHRGGKYPFLRAALCVVVRDLIVYGVVQDMMVGRPAIYATFSSYDEVAHHSGLERADTMEALRKLDQQFGRIDRSRRYAARPYEIVVLSDHGQTQGATFRQRNGYGLDDLVRRNLTGAAVTSLEGGDEQHAMVGHALNEATGSKLDGAEGDVEGGNAIVLGSGNLGLVYLMEEQRRLSLEEIDDRHPELLPALVAHPHIGWVLAHSDAHGAVVLGANGRVYLDEDRVEGESPLEPFAPGAADHLRREDGFANAADLTIGSFYDAALDEGCAFEELISFHGGLGGPQTRPFLFYPAHLPLDPEPIVGAEAVNRILAGWRKQLNGS
ncbi:MAG TPA: phage holin family protein [Gaiellaceae bacterium]|nr:phage holin family protein [Gaiellaceae bacterium]